MLCAPDRSASDMYDTPPHGLTSAGTPSAENLMASELSSAEPTKVVATLNHILELELAGLVRYLHYSFMIFGHNRIPIVAWLRAQADEAQARAVCRRGGPRRRHRQDAAQARFHQLTWGRSRRGEAGVPTRSRSLLKSE